MMAFTVDSGAEPPPGKGGGSDKPGQLVLLDADGDVVGPVVGGGFTTIVSQFVTSGFGTRVQKFRAVILMKIPNTTKNALVEVRDAGFFTGVDSSNNLIGSMIMFESNDCSVDANNKVWLDPDNIGIPGAITPSVIVYRPTGELAVYIPSNEVIQQNVVINSMLNPFGNRDCEAQSPGPFDLIEAELADPDLLATYPEPLELGFR